VTTPADRAPVLTEAPATNVRASEATASGTMQPEGLATTCAVQWGTSAAYGN
jgi:hypothetical protein